MSFKASQYILSHENPHKLHTSRNQDYFQYCCPRLHVHNYGETGEAYVHAHNVAKLAHKCPVLLAYICPWARGGSRVLVGDMGQWAYSKRIRSHGTSWTLVGNPQPSACQTHLHWYIHVCKCHVKVMLYLVCQQDCSGRIQHSSGYEVCYNTLLNDCSQLVDLDLLFVLKLIMYMYIWRVCLFSLSGSVAMRLAVSRRTSYPKDVWSGLMDSFYKCL